MDAKKSCIVIPFYKTKLTDLEIISLKQAVKIFSKHDIIIVKPRSLKLKMVIDEFGLNYNELSFDDRYFDSIQGYNELMMSSYFYKQFLAYHYMLIYQLDAFVFRDELDLWCSKNYDYIGAPWLRSEIYHSTFKQFKEAIRSFYHRRYNIIRKDGLPDSERQLNNQVGNGGFSLRKVDRFYHLSIQYKDLIKNYLQQSTSHYNEDIFWSIALNRKTSLIKKPELKEALKFAIETAPDRAIKLTRGELPFGCHAWDKNLDFWVGILKKYGYDINQKHT